MKEYTWKESNYTLLKSSWGISIWLEAGYQMVSDIEDKNKYIKISDRIYFHSMLSYFPDNPNLTVDEVFYFCNGLRLISKYLQGLLQEDSFLLIALRKIRFSDCDLQIEGFTACAIQWASETFCFPMPTIKTYFDPKKSVSGKYVFDFSSV